MSIPTYRTGFPQDGASLGSTRTQIRDNLDGTFLTLGVDHINNNGAPGTGVPGYHNVIHFQDQGAVNPAPIAGVTQEYTRTDANGIQQILLESTAGNVYQQTRMIDGSFASFSANPGWTYLPGALLMQWGAINAPGGGPITVTFPTAFTSAPYIIELTARNDGPHSAFTYFVDGAPTNTNFVYRGSTTGSETLFWLAIGK